MKNLHVLVAIVILVAGAYAQAPNKMSYQSVLRNTNGLLIVNQSVGMRISILRGSAAGTAVYVETHAKITNVNGLVSLEIGGGTPVTGTMSGIDWNNGPYFIKTETDPSGGANYTMTGTSELLSVPYALHATSSATATTLSPNATGVVRTVNGQSGNIILAGSGGTTISSSGDTLKISGGGGSAGWSLTGNAATIAANNYLGTSDNQPLILRTNNTERLRILGGGNVGIGTDSPLLKLQVHGGIMGISGGGYLQVGPLDASDNFGYITAAGSAVTTGGTGMKFETCDGASVNGAIRMTITNNGNVGIGTSSPAAPLHVVSSNGLISLLESSQDFGTVLQMKPTFTGGRTFELQSTANGATEGAGKFLINDRTAAATRLSIASSGEVGIGTATPTGELHIVSQRTTSPASVIKQYAPNLTASTGTVIAQGKNTSTGNSAEYRFDYTGDGSVLNTHAFGFSNIQPFVFFTVGQRVGVGTSSPAAKLDITGTIKIADGTQGAGKLLTADANGLASWKFKPDTNSINITPFMLNSSYFFGGPTFSTGPTGAPCVNFPDGVTSEIDFTVITPTDFNTATHTIKVYYTSSTTSGDFDCSLFSRGYATDANMTAGVGGGGLLLTPPATTNTLKVGITDGSGQFDSSARVIYFKLRRRGGSSTDTSTGTMKLFGLSIEWIK